MPSRLAPPPKRGALLDYDELRAACADAVPDRDRPPSVSAISNAVRESGSKVAALQLDIIAALTGASFDGPLYRVA